MGTKLLVFSFALLLVFVAVPAFADTWTVTASGIIGPNSFDNAGLFGSVGALLQGLSYTDTITTVPSLNSPPYAPYTVTMTVNGVSYTQTGYPSQNEGYLDDALSTNDVATTLQDQVFQQVYSQGWTGPATPNTMATYILAYSTTNPFVPSLDINQSITDSTGLDPGSNTWFSFTDGEGQSTIFYGTISTISVNPPTATPEPSSLVLLAIGLSGLVAVRFNCPHSARVSRAG